MKEKTEAGTGYFKKSIPGGKMQPEMGNINVNIYNSVSTTTTNRSTDNEKPSLA